MDSLGIDVGALDSDNMRTFKRVTVSTEVFTYEEVVVWFRMLSKISKCQGLAACAEEYAHRLVVDDEMDHGRYWLIEKEEFWLSFMKRAHYRELMAFGLDRDVQLPLIGTPGARTQGSPFQGTPGVTSYGNSLPTPPVATGADGITAAMAGFQWKHPTDIPLSIPALARAAAVVNAAINPPRSTVTGATAASEIAEAFLTGMNTFTAQMKESAKSQLSLTEDDKLDKPVPGILILEPDMGHKITVSAFLVWL